MPSTPYALAKSKSRRSLGKSSTQLGSKSGLILICDIVDFSLLSREEQRQAVQRLWQYIDRDDAVRTLGADRIINGTGDGFMIACPDHKQEVDHEEFIKFAEGMIRHMARSRPRRGLRIGIHQGAFTSIDLEFPIDGLGQCKSRQGVGKGINRCARIVSISDDGDITVTEQFINEWADTANDSIRERFSPRPDKDPFEIIVKHGETLKLRLHRPGNRVNRPWPRKIRGMQDAQRQLGQQLELIRIGFEEYLELLCNSLDLGLDVRVSIFARGNHKDAGFLLPTQFRHHLKDHGVGEGSTRYSIKNHGSGAAGRAFVGHSPVQLIHLPDPRRQLKRYIAELAGVGLDRKTVRGFYRKARAFIAFPFGMDARHPDGVVCIDVLEPLAQLSAKDVTEVARFLQSHFSVTLSSLWRLRGQI